MGSLFRCTTCSKEMVIEAYHAGRNVPCPWCRARNDIPVGIDFREVDTAQAKDESRGGTLLMLAFAGIICLPLSAWVWWAAHGRLSRADDEGRPGDGLLRAARWIAAIFSILQIFVIGLVVVSRL